MRKYFLFKHEDVGHGTTTMVEVYGFGDVLQLLAETGLQVENAMIISKNVKPRGMNYEWAEGAYPVVGQVEGHAKVLGMCNFRE